MRRRDFMFSALTALIAYACIPFGDAWFDFSGVVRDEQGHPIENAKLEILVNGRLARGRSVTTTDRAGNYEFFESSCPCDFQFELRVSKAGYCTLVKRLSGRAANSLRHLDVLLQSGSDCGGGASAHEGRNRARSIAPCRAPDESSAPAPSPRMVSAGTRTPRL